MSVFVNLRSSKVNIKRTYKKLQDVLSNIGGLMPILKLMGEFLVLVMNKVTRNISFANKLFSFDEFNKTIHKKVNNVNLGNNEKKEKELNKLNSLDKLENENQVKDRKENLNYIQLVSVNSMINNLKNNAAKNDDKKLANEFLEFEKLSKRRHKIKLSFCDILFTTLCHKKCLPENFKQKKKLINIINLYFAEHLDIIYLVENSKELDLMKSLILTENERLLMRFVPKPAFHQQEDNKEKMKEKLLFELAECHKEIKNREKTEKEEKLYEILDNDLFAILEDTVIKQTI